MQNSAMRTTITLDDDVHDFAVYYANAKGITLSAAMNELVRKAERAPAAQTEISNLNDPQWPPVASSNRTNHYI